MRRPAASTHCEARTVYEYPPKESHPSIFLFSRSISKICPKMARRKSKRPSTKTAIANSSAFTSDAAFEDADTDELNSPDARLRRILKEVAVPSERRLSAKQLASNSVENSSISGDLSTNESNGYETPGTSAAATPAATISLKTKATFPQQKSVTLAQRGKRKRPTKDVDGQLEEDELLAQELQAREYIGDAGAFRTSQRRRVLDSDEESVLSLPDSDSDFLSDLDSPDPVPASKPRSRGSLFAKAPAKRRLARLPSARGRASRLLGTENEDDSLVSVPDSSEMGSDYDSLTAESTDDGGASNAQDEDNVSNNDPLGTVRYMRRRRGRYNSRVSPVFTGLQL